MLHSDGCLGGLNNNERKEYTPVENVGELFVDSDRCLHAIQEFIANVGLLKA